MNKELPLYVSLKKNRYVYQPPNEHEQPLRLNGKLLREDSLLSDIWLAYDEMVNCVGSLNWLVSSYLKSPQFFERAYKTQHEYTLNAQMILNKRLTDGAIFGSIQVGLVTSGVVRRYLDSRKDAQVCANREIAFLSAVFSWAKERDMVLTNPCRGVRRNKEQARDRYIEDWEYRLVYDLAKRSGSPYLCPLMELSYLCRARKKEVINLKNVDVTEGGILIRRTKGSLPELTLYSDRLKAAIQSARNINKDVDSEYLLHSQCGSRLVSSSVDTAWQRLMINVVGSEIEYEGKKYILKERFTFHDIKAAGVSDHVDNESGHKTEKAKAVYMRKIREVEATR